MQSFRDVVKNGRVEPMKRYRPSKFERYMNHIPENSNFRLSVNELESLAAEQRDYVADLNRQFSEISHRTLEPFTFVHVRIEHIESPRKFYVTQIALDDVMASIQEGLNQTYNQCAQEPFAKVYLNDVCAVYVGTVWYRGRVQRMINIDENRQRFEVLLIDYGLTVLVTHEELRLLKSEFIRNAPMATPCSLTVLNACEREMFENTKKMQKLTNAFEQIVKLTNDWQIYVNNSINRNPYHVYLFTCNLLPKSLSHRGAYLLHEMYAAFSIPNITCVDAKFIGLETSSSVLNTDYVARSQPNSGHSIYSKKVRVKLAHIVSPLELYVQYKIVVKNMRGLRTKIDAFVATFQKLEKRKISEWAPNENCLVQTLMPNERVGLKLWHRGRICSIANDSGKASVFLRDFGPTVTAVADDLTVIPSNLAGPVDGVRKCYLESPSEWLDSSSDALNLAISQYKYFAISVGTRNEHGSSAITLWATNELPDPANNAIWCEINRCVTTHGIIKLTENYIALSQYQYNIRKYAIPTSKCINPIAFEAITKRDKMTQSNFTKAIDSEPSTSEVYLELTFNFNDIDLSDDDDNNKFSACGDDSDHDQLDDESLAANYGVNDAHDAYFRLIEPIYYDLSDELLYYGNPVQIWLPSEPITRTIFSATPTHISNNGIIYLQDAYRRHLTTQMSKMIYQQLKQSGQYETIYRDWIKGQTCFARFFVDQQFYRGIVQRVDRAKSLCLVKFVDFGNCSVCKFEDLRTANMFARIPVLVRKYGLVNCQPLTIDKKWSAYMLRLCRIYIIDQMCLVRVCNTENVHNRIACCSITPHYTRIDLKTWLIQNELCIDRIVLQ